MPLWGGIEAGGTKTVCAVGTGPEDLRAEVRFPTTTPTDTIQRVIQFFREQTSEEPLAAVGIASFGPLDLDPQSPRFGYITSTPKPGWARANLAGSVRRSLGTPVGLDTDVNAAALGEHQWGAARGLDDFVYLTVGTGIGGGAMVNGRLTHGLSHPEMGHIRIPHDRALDPFDGSCPYHGDCLEGLASGPALEARWGQHGATLGEDHPAWPLEADYLAFGLVNLICILLPQRIIMGGGIMQQPQIFPLLRRKVQELLNGYLQAPEILDQIDEYIVPPGLGNRAGVLGALVLAQRAAQGATGPIQTESSAAT
ncbi:MAG: ROK family protein [Dehalococcoidia bacterium]|nr:ROK family protein [Dehalococcoidia bacterium]